MSQPKKSGKQFSLNFKLEQGCLDLQLSSPLDRPVKLLLSVALIVLLQLVGGWEHLKLLLEFFR